MKIEKAIDPSSDPVGSAQQTAHGWAAVSSGPWIVTDTKGASIEAICSFFRAVQAAAVNADNAFVSEGDTNQDCGVLIHTAQQPLDGTPDVPETRPWLVEP